MQTKIHERLKKIAVEMKLHTEEAQRLVRETRVHEIEIIKLQGEQRALERLLPEKEA